METVPKRDTIAMISDSSGVRLGLALAMCGGCVAVYSKLGSIETKVREDMATHYITRDLFTAEMNGLRREFDTFRTSLSELKLSVAAAAQDAAKSR